MSELKLLQCRLDARYDIEECLGRGSYAEIYVARDRAATGREVSARSNQSAQRACSRVIRSLNSSTPLIQNFQNEAIALDRVRHPNIISRLGHGTALDLNGTGVSLHRAGVSERR
jgi:serine/threonine protein kinase